MATSTYGTPYVESGDLVSAWPTTSQSVADRVDDVSIKGNGVNTQTGTTYTTVLTDAGKTVTLDNAAAVAVTIPPNASVAYETGTQIKFLNLGAGTVTLGPGSGVTLNGDTLNAAQYIGLAAIKVNTDEWVVLPFSGGAGSAQISGSPTGTYSSGGVNYAYYSITATGSLVVDSEGLADVLVVAGGGGGNTVADGGGGGGSQNALGQSILLPAGTYTITIGAGGSGTSSSVGNNGTQTTFDTLVRCNPGGGGNKTNFGQPGGGGQGGGGAGGGSTGIGGNIVGLTSSITGTSVEYGRGGAGVGGAGAANTGTGGGGSSGGSGSNGGSGVVIVRVKV